MSVLQALNRYYDRMAARGEAEPPGFSREKISFAIVLSPEGALTDVDDLRSRSGKKLVPRLIEVPAAEKRASGIKANRLWDKTAYVLGRTAGEGRRTSEEHAAFKALHRDLLADATDEGLVALSRFLQSWTPERFDGSRLDREMLDTNVVFRLEGEYGYIHDREAARLLLADDHNESAGEMCLVTGLRAPVRRLHPVIKGVQGAQSSGASLVSFNLDAFTSYGKEQGANAPVSEAAAFRYGAALNRMLDRDSKNRLRHLVGDATIVFWADASEVAARTAELIFMNVVEPPDDGEKNLDKDAQEAAKLREQLEKIAAGRPTEVDPELRAGTRFHVLGLAPNAARLSIRYWLDDDFSHFAKRLLDHANDMRIEPPPRRWGAKTPSVSRLLVKTVALQEKFENIPPLLAGEVMRAILSGARYPRAWLAAAIMRLRAGDDAGSGWHAAVIRAVLERDRRLSKDGRGSQDGQEVPMSLDKTRPDDPAYHLGRLFAALEVAQRMALRSVNATIRDRYFGAASATPAIVFPLLFRGAQNHLGKLRKEHKAGWIEKEIGEIVDQLPAGLPRSLALEAQGHFAIGYYHQRQSFFATHPKSEIAMTEEGGAEQDEENTDV